jgi:molybdopterin biosynthesis enzyme
MDNAKMTDLEVIRVLQDDLKFVSKNYEKHLDEFDLLLAELKGYSVGAKDLTLKEILKKHLEQRSI